MRDQLPPIQIHGLNEKEIGIRKEQMDTCNRQKPTHEAIPETDKDSALNKVAISNKVNANVSQYPK